MSDIQEQVRTAARILREGGIVLFPTDTVYALAVDATNTEAIQKLKRLKGRDEGKPITVVVADMAMAEKYVIVNDVGRKLTGRFLPGALTLIFERKNTVPDELIGGGTTLGIRIPDHQFCLALVNAFGSPYTATSANVSGEETKRTVADIIDQFDERASLIDYIVDEGELPLRKPSTIVDVHNGEVTILREGAIASERILKMV